ncbi:MAG: GNAT family N-acetyltransferase [Acidobacteria bacterium]|nr:GNAT family N-acetyltransferase [Acidobacteriota bacterium]MCA1650453.1 GNAT family N-acetyltransferase [Acidobacteriota bacterium]
MTVYTFNPLDDGRWGEFVDRHPSASLFHAPGWVKALQQTYVYQPVVYTTSPPEALLNNGILLSRVRSWLTGRSLVSVPFADHCEPLVAVPEDLAAILDALRAVAGGWKYVELRPRTSGPWDDLGLAATTSFRFHVLDLRPPLEDVRRGFKESAVQRKIKRAEREGVSCEEGRSEALLQAFYRLTLLTRRRHGIPPQPIQWFRNLIGCFGDRLTIRVAVKGGHAIGGILTLQHRKTLVYKYGCSDARFHNLGTMPLLFWTTIKEAKSGRCRDVRPGTFGSR